jgi:predicted nucleotidyltransferase
MRQAILCLLAAASLLLVTSAATFASGSRASFGASTNFAVGTFPRAVAVGDFNADSDPDLAVANYGSDNVSVLLGRAGGSFGARSNLAVGDGPGSIAIGDFNGDSDPDLAVANASSNSVSIRLGGPGGSFGAAGELPTNTYPSPTVGDAVPTSVAVGDFNADSDPDLVVTNSLRDNVLVWLGGAGGSFGAPTDFPVGEFPQSVAIGDFNGDSDPDLAVANLGFAGSSDPSISVLLGGAGGTFAPAANLVLPPRPNAVAIGDFNADSDPDLAVANSRNVSILLGGAGGSFGAASDFTAGRDLNAVVVGHLNGDSDPDLAVVNGFSGNLNDDRVSVLLGGAGGSFGVPASFKAGDDPVAVAVGDFNADSDPDLAVANVDSNDVSVLLNDTTAPQTRITAGPAGSTADRTPTFRFKSNERGSRFQCKLDRSPFRTCRSPNTLRRLASGRHTFKVRATDTAGNTDLTPATRTLRVREGGRA